MRAPLECWLSRNSTCARAAAHGSRRTARRRATRPRDRRRSFRRRCRRSPVSTRLRCVMAGSNSIQGRTALAAPAASSSMNLSARGHFPPYPDAGSGGRPRPGRRGVPQSRASSATPSKRANGSLRLAATMLEGQPFARHRQPSASAKLLQRRVAVGIARSNSGGVASNAPSTVRCVRRAQCATMMQTAAVGDDDDRTETAPAAPRSRRPVASRSSRPMAGRRPRRDRRRAAASRAAFASVARQSHAVPGR